MAGTLIAIVQKRRKTIYPAERRVVADSVYVKPKGPIKTVRVPPTQAKAAVVSGAIVVPIPPEFQGAGQTEFELSVKHRTG
jgi:hypothetical protein